MLLRRNQPLLYLITGAAVPIRGPESDGFSGLLKVVAAAVKARVDLIQIREKQLDARRLSNLVRSAANLTRDSSTWLLVNDRADIALTAGADGVHLTTQSIEANIVRQSFPPEFLIGVSTHSLDEAKKARDAGADFATFGPVFDTPSKRQYGLPLGLEPLRETAFELAPFPILALGGVTIGNSLSALKTGAMGLASIRLFDDVASLYAVVKAIRDDAAAQSLEIHPA